MASSSSSSSSFNQGNKIKINQMAGRWLDGCQPSGSVNSQSRKKKIFRIERLLAADFEKVCTILGILEQDAVSQAIRDWLKKNEIQTSLENWTRESRQPVTFQSVTLVKIQVNIVRSELEAALRAYRECDPACQIDWLKTIQKILPTAMALHSAVKDRELERLIREVECISQEARS